MVSGERASDGCDAACLLRTTYMADSHFSTKQRVMDCKPNYERGSLFN